MSILDDVLDDVINPKPHDDGEPSWRGRYDMDDWMDARSELHALRALNAEQGKQIEQLREALKGADIVLAEHGFPLWGHIREEIAALLHTSTHQDTPPRPHSPGTS